MMYRILITYCLLLITGLAEAKGFIDPSCPSGWDSVGDDCIRLFLSSEKTTEAKKNCEADGAELFKAEYGQEWIEDITEVLNNLSNKGVLEYTWLVSPVDGVPRVLKRNEKHQYQVVSVAESSSFPFICSLSDVDKRMLNYQHRMLPKGAPRFRSLAPLEVYFHPRSGADFVPLSCDVEGEPQPNIQWYRNDVIMVNPSSNESYLLSGGTLLVPAAQSLAYSTFHCVASNKHGKIRSPSILLKPAFLESFAPRRSDVLPLNDGGARLDCDPPNHQPKSQSYSWFIGNTERLVQQTSRVLISLDGSLLFSHVDPDDDQKYACALSLSSTQSAHYGPFFRLRIAGAQPKFAPRLASQPQIFPETPVAAETVFLECFAFSNPPAIYKWSRVDGRSLDSSRVTVLNFGRVLRIDNSQVSDEGRYRCQAGNVIGAAQADVTLTLKAVPSVLIPLTDGIFPSQSDFSFDCPLASADRHSTIEWFKDSRPIVPLLLPNEERKRIKIRKNKLHVSSTRYSDSGVYQCIVSNEFAVSTSSALLVIQDAPPTFPRQSMPTKVFTVKGATLNIPCVYQASPRGSTKWTDAGGSRIPRKGRIHDKEGTLTIEHVLEDDAGMFFCTVHNRLGKAHAQVELIILEKPKVRLHPDGKTPLSSENITCEVEMECDKGECPDPVLQFTVDDQPVAGYGSKVHSVQHVKRNNVVHVTENVEFKIPTPSSSSTERYGRFSCSSLFGSASADLNQRTVSSAPMGIRVETEKEGIYLTFKTTSSHRETRDHQVDDSRGFLLEFRTRRDRRWRSAPREVVKKTEEDGFHLHSLEPNTAYQFRVRSLLSSDIGEASSPSDWIVTPPTAPRSSVEGLKWKQLDNSTLLVEWRNMKQNTESPENLRYKISWSEGTASGFTHRYHAHSIESPVNHVILRLNSTDGCRTVTLAVRAVNDQGEAPTSTDAVAVVSSDGELRRVRVEDAYAVNGTHLNISWSWDGSNECEISHAVQITCSYGDDSVVASVSAHQNSYLIHPLKPLTDYECSIKPLDPKGNVGEESSAIVVRTKQNPPIDKPEIAKLSLKPTSDKTGYTTILEWTAVQLGELNNTDQTGYKIFIYISETASEAVELSMSLDRISDLERPSARLDGLRLMYMYTIQVAGYNSGGLGPLSEPYAVRLGSSASFSESSAHSISSSFLILFPVLLLF